MKKNNFITIFSLLIFICTLFFACDCEANLSESTKTPKPPKITKQDLWSITSGITKNVIVPAEIDGKEYLLAFYTQSGTFEVTSDSRNEPSYTDEIKNGTFFYYDHNTYIKITNIERDPAHQYYVAETAFLETQTEKLIFKPLENPEMTYSKKSKDLLYAKYEELTQKLEDALNITPDYTIEINGDKKNFKLTSVKISVFNTTVNIKTDIDVSNPNFDEIKVDPNDYPAWVTFYINLIVNNIANQSISSSADIAQILLILGKYPKVLKFSTDFMDKVIKFIDSCYNTNLSKDEQTALKNANTELESIDLKNVTVNIDRTDDNLYFSILPTTKYKFVPQYDATKKYNIFTTENGTPQWLESVINIFTKEIEKKEISFASYLDSKSYKKVKELYSLLQAEYKEVEKFVRQIAYPYEYGSSPNFTSYILNYQRFSDENSYCCSFTYKYDKTLNPKVEHCIIDINENSKISSNSSNVQIKKLIQGINIVKTYPTITQTYDNQIIKDTFNIMASWASPLKSTKETLSNAITELSEKFSVDLSEIDTIFNSFSIAGFSLSDQTIDLIFTETGVVSMKRNSISVDSKITIDSYSLTNTPTNAETFKNFLIILNACLCSNNKEEICNAFGEAGYTNIKNVINEIFSSFNN